MTRTVHGFTLIEVLVSVAILAFVVAGISQVLIKQSPASSVQAGQPSLEEESGRLALIELAAPFGSPDTASIHRRVRPSAASHAPRRTPRSHLQRRGRDAHRRAQTSWWCLAHPNFARKVA